MAMRKKSRKSRPIGFIDRPGKYRLAYRRGGKTVVGKKVFKTKLALKKYVVKLMRKK